MPDLSSNSVSIFISYAREDEKWLHMVDKHFSVLYNKQIITRFDDRRLTIGDKWDDVIKAKIEEADLVILLVSADFLSSYYIHQVELRHSLERHQSNKCWLLPIIVSSCYWEEEDFAGVMVYP